MHNDGFLEFRVHILEYIKEKMGGLWSIIANEGFIEGRIVLCHLYNL